MKLMLARKIQTYTRWILQTVKHSLVVGTQKQTLNFHEPLILVDIDNTLGGIYVSETASRSGLENDFAISFITVYE
jgi:hypothetical protein